MQACSHTFGPQSVLFALADSERGALYCPPEVFSWTQTHSNDISKNYQGSFCHRYLCYKGHTGLQSSGIMLKTLLLCTAKISERNNTFGDLLQGWPCACGVHLGESCHPPSWLSKISPKDASLPTSLVVSSSLVSSGIPLPGLLFGFFFLG